MITILAFFIFLSAGKVFTVSAKNLAGRSIGTGGSTRLWYKAGIFSVLEGGLVTVSLVMAETPLLSGFMLGGAWVPLSFAIKTITTVVIVFVISSLMD